MKSHLPRILILAGLVVIVLAIWQLRKLPREPLPQVDSQRMHSELERLRPLVERYEKKSARDRLAGLRSADGNDRLAAIMALEERGPFSAEAVPDLVDNLKTSVEDLRLHAALALGKVGAPAVPALREALGSPDPEVRYHALLALSLTGEAGRSAAPQVLAALNDQSEPVRHKAAYTLGKLLPDSANVIPALAAALADDSEDVRQQAAEALVEFKGRAVPALLPLLQSESPQRAQALTALAGIGPEAAAAVPPIRDLAQANPAARPQAIQTLVAIGKPALPALEELMRGDAATKQLVLQNLWGRPADGIDILLVSLKDESAEIRALGLNILSASGIADKQVVLAIAELTRDRDAGVRLQAVHSLMSQGQAARDALPALRRAAQDQEPSVRQAAERALQIIGEQ